MIADDALLASLGGALRLMPRELAQVSYIFFLHDICVGVRLNKMLSELVHKLPVDNLALAMRPARLGVSKHLLSFSKLFLI